MTHPPRIPASRLALPLGLLVVLAVISVAGAVPRPVAGTPGHAGQPAAHAPAQSGPAQSGPVQTTLEPTRMVWIAGGDPSNRFADRGYVWVGHGAGSGSTGGPLRGILSFELEDLPDGAAITSARLHGTIAEARGGDHEFDYDVLPVLSYWDRQYVSWTQQPLLGAASDSVPIRAGFGSSSWDVTSLAQAWYSGAQANYGIALVREDDEANRTEHARSFRDLRLVVSYDLIASIVKVDAEDPVPAGDTVDYAITVRNTSSGALSALRVVDALPQGTSMDRASPGGVLDGTSIAWDLPTLPAGAETRLTLSVLVDTRTPVGTVLTNRAALSICNGPRGACTPLGEATTTTTVSAATSVVAPVFYCPVDESGNTLEAATTLRTGAGGQRGTVCPETDEDWYRFSVTTAATIHVVLRGLTNDLDVELVSPSGTVVATGDRSGRTDESVSATAAETGDWRVRVYAPERGGLIARYQLFVVVRLGAPPPTRTPLPPPSRPEVTVSKSLEEDGLVPGGRGHFAIRIANAGSAGASGLQVVDLLPEGLSVVSADPAGGRWEAARRTYTWPQDALSAGGVTTYRLTVEVDASLSGRTLSNRVEVTHADAASAIVASCAADVTTPRVDLSVVTVTSPVVAGRNVTVRGTVCNPGAAALSNVTVVSTVTSDLLEVSPVGGQFSPFDDRVTWTFASLAPDICAEAEYGARISAGLDAGDVIVTHWSARADGVASVERDHRIGINRSEVPATVELDWVLSRDVVSAGNAFWITATVRVESALALEDMRLRFRPSEGFMIAGMDRSCARENNDTENVVCPLDGASGTHMRDLRLYVVHLAPGNTVSDPGVTLEVSAAGIVPVIETVPVRIRSDVDIDGIEVTQSIQRYPENDVLLAAGRKTWVRVYPDSDPGPTDGVDCRLTVFRCTARCDERLGALDPLPVGEDGPTARTVSTSPDRGDGRESFIFGLPVDWAGGTVELEAEVNPGCGHAGAASETDCANNVERLRVRFETVPSLRVSQVHGIQVDGALVTRPPVDVLDPMVEYARGSLPYRTIHDLGRGPQGMRLNGYDFTTTDGWEDALADLATLHDRSTDDSRRNAQWVLVLPTFPEGYGPLAWGGMADGHRDLIVDSRQPGEVLAHEMVHNNGLDHSDGCSPEPPIDRTLDARLGQYGFDAETLRIYPPGTWDLMTYCAGRWPAATTYERILDDLLGTGARLSSSGALETAQIAEPEMPGIRVSGTVSRDGASGAIRTILARPWAGGPHDEPGGGALALVLRDAAGAALFERRFEAHRALPYGLAQGGGPPGALFAEILPGAPGTVAVTLERDTAILDRRSIAASAPMVTLLSPNGGETLDAPHEARWTAIGADLSFDLEYSRDDGATWIPVASSITDTHALLDPGNMPGSDRGRMRVFATSGGRAGWDVSDAAFSVPDHAPEIRIVRPAQGARFRSGAPVLLTAAVRDVEDADIAESVEWSSDVAGFIGAGSSRVARYLEPGTHVLTVVATDGSGNRAEARVTIAVVPEVPSPHTCAARLLEADFETGWSGWAREGVSAPAIVSLDVPTRTHAVLLADPGVPDRPGSSAIRHALRVPAATASATLAMRYRVVSDDAIGADRFEAVILDADGRARRTWVLERQSTDWRSATIDLAEHAGRAVQVVIRVFNDGQGGRTFAYVDDVAFCLSAAPAVAGPVDTCWARDGLTDYAPSGLPDFDARRPAWRSPETGTWSHDGPAAVADVLWWLDSAVETGGLAPGPQPDHSMLVPALGPWGDHDARNVEPLIGRLASLMGTNREGPGTEWSHLVEGVRSHLSGDDLGGRYAVFTRRAPSLDWVRDSSARGRGVVLQLGLWELQAEGWRRIGGRYVGLAGVDCDADRVGLSDPLRDAAEPRWAPGLAGADPAAWLAAGATAHDDAALASHDVYGVTRATLGDAWGPQGYAPTFASVAEMVGANGAADLADASATGYAGGTIVVLVDHALVVAPTSPLVALSLSPSAARLRAGAATLVGIELDTGGRAIDGVRVHLDFDPSVLQVVDEAGRPTSSVVPGAMLPDVVANRVDHASGRIHFGADGPPITGRGTVAVFRVRAVTATAESEVRWSADAPRQSAVVSQGGDILDITGDLLLRFEPAGRLLTDLEVESAPPDPGAAAPLAVVLRRPGERGAAYVLGAPHQRLQDTALTGVVAPGRYTAWTRSLHALTAVTTARVVPGASSVSLGSLVEGDALADGRIDARDLSLVVSVLGSRAGEPAFDPRADLTYDAAVDAADVAVVRRTYGLRGEMLPVDAASGAATAGLDDEEPESLARLDLVPADGDRGAGPGTALDIVVDSCATALDVATFEVTYDPAIVRLVEALPLTGAEVFLEEVDAARGRATYVLLAGPPCPGDAARPIARLLFAPVGPGVTEVRFAFDGREPTNVLRAGASVLGAVSGAAIEGRGGVFLPVGYAR